MWSNISRPSIQLPKNDSFISGSISVKDFPRFLKAGIVGPDEKEDIVPFNADRYNSLSTLKDRLLKNVISVSLPKLSLSASREPPYLYET